MPDRPSINRPQVGSTPHASGVTMPNPVTTTRLMAYQPDLPMPGSGAAPHPSGASAMRLDEVDRVFDGHDLFRGIVGNFAPEGFFECHNQFHGVEAVGPKIVDETRI